MAERTIIRLRETGSTNRDLKQLALSGCLQGSIVTAECQREGRGRLGRSFISPVGGLYLSYLLRPTTPPGETASVTAWAAVAVADAIRDVIGLECRIKWVNDLQLAGKKVCGILTEMAGNAVIIGIGINVNNLSFPEEIADRATSLCLTCGKKVDSHLLTNALVDRLDLLRAQWPFAKEEYRRRYISLCETVGQQISFLYHGEERQGTAVGIGPDFELSVDIGGNMILVSSGEVTLHKEGNRNEEKR